MARVGGDEFVVLLPETGGDAAAQIAKKLQKALLPKLRMGDLAATVSMGVVTCTQPAKSAEEVLRIADSLMYDTKSKGKNQMILPVL